MQDKQQDTQQKYLNFNKKKLFMGVISVAAIFVAYKLYKRQQQSIYNINCNMLPGPKASDTTLGNFNDMSAAGSLHEYLQELTDTYGRIGAFYWGTKRVAYITSQQILCDDHNKRTFDKVTDRPQFLFEGFKPLIGEYSIQYANGANFHSRYRGVYLKGYQYNMINKMGTMIKLCRETINKWNKLIDSNDTVSATIDIMDEAFIFAAKSIIYASFGSDINDSLVRSIITGYKDTWYEIEKRLICGIPPNDKRTKKFQNDLQKMYDTVRTIMKHQSNSNDKGLFLKLIRENKSWYDTEQKIFDEAITAIAGGTHTTGYGVSWIFYYISKHQLIQEKMFNEIKKHFNISENIDNISVKIISDKLKKLAYCRQVITETLRISCLAPWSARINYNTDMYINKCDGSNNKIVIPKGMAFIIGHGVALNDKNVFNEAFKFNPDRWNRKNVRNSKVLKQSVNAMFGGLGGERMCPGWSFFRTESLIFCVAILSKFKVKLSDNVVIKRTFGLVTSPADKLQIVIEKR